MNCEQENRRSPRIGEMELAVPIIAGCERSSVLISIFFGWPTAWMSIVIVTLIRHGARGLWLLLGAPFALFWFWFPYGNPRLFE